MRLPIHGRESENIILPIVEGNTLRWVDKEKGLHWLSSAQTNAQAITKETLDSATKIVESFENPKVPVGNLDAEYSIVRKLGEQPTDPDGGGKPTEDADHSIKPKAQTKDYISHLLNI